MSVYLAPAAASGAISAILLVMGQPVPTVVLAAAAVFPAVYLLTNQAGVSVKSAASSDSFYHELERANDKKKAKKEKRVAEAKKREDAKQQTQAQPKAAPAVVAESTEDEADAETEEVEVAKPKSKAAAKKAKQKAAREAEEARLKAEAEAKKKAEEAEKKKKKKKAKKEAVVADSEAVKSSPPASEPKPSPATASRISEDAAGWSVQKSEKPSSNKQSKNAKAKSASSPSTASPVASSESVAKSGAKKDSAPVPVREEYAELYIPFKHHAQLIGAKGATLQQLTSASGARIDMPKKDSGSTKVQITGTAEAVKAAQGAIDSLITKGYSSFTHPGWVHDDLSVDEKHMGIVIGPGGAHLKAIQNKTSTRINMPEKDTKGGKITIVGKKEDVRLARLAIKELIQDGFSPITHEGFVKREVAFPSDKLHLLIGTKGQTIKSIQGNTKTKINIPDRAGRASGTAPINVTIVGEPAGVIQAEKEVLRLLIPPEIVEEEPEEEYTNGTWSAAGTEEELWD